MRIWTISPKYLDTKGLVALWRETLLAKHVLLGKTRGYKNHPQLLRFKNHPEPTRAIDHYLSFIIEEAGIRGYNFDPKKVSGHKVNTQIDVTKGQIIYELEHLRSKLTLRDPEKFELIKDIEIPETLTLFNVVEGEIEQWEKV